MAFYGLVVILCWYVFFFQAEDGIRDLVRSRGLGDVYKRQLADRPIDCVLGMRQKPVGRCLEGGIGFVGGVDALSLIHI